LLPFLCFFPPLIYDFLPLIPVFLSFLVEFFIDASSVCAGATITAIVVVDGVVVRVRVVIVTIID
jgi:uncharacterized membrane protein YccC